MLPLPRRPPHQSISRHHVAGFNMHSGSWNTAQNDLDPSKKKASTRDTTTNKPRNTNIAGP